MKRKRALLLLALVTVLTALFAWRQNLGGVVGGPISLPKTLWLNWTLIVFFAIPFCLWRDRGLSAGMRGLFGWVLASFAARGVIELIVIYFTHGWRCGYGISHDLFTFALVVVLRRSQPRDLAPFERNALHFSTILQAALLIEAAMAWLFSRAASPAAGVYFAANTRHFQFINNFTWFVLAMLYPLLALWLLRARRIPALA